MTAWIILSIETVIPSFAKGKKAITRTVVQASSSICHLDGCLSCLRDSGVM